MKTSHLIGGMLTASMVMLSAGGEQPKVSTNTSTIQATENKMMVLPSPPLHSISSAQTFPVTGQLIMLEADIAVPVKPKQQKAEK